jgi:ComF family protein
LGLFDDPLRTLIHQLKYRSRWPLAEQLADRLLQQPAMQTLMKQTDLLISVPLHRLRQVARGYNQAEVIAHRLARRCGLRLVHPVVRLKRTRTQTQIRSLAVRRSNLRDAFVLVRPEQVRGQRVVIVDDVMTSAATLLTLARTLRRADPAGISACVLAVADPRGRGFEYI